MNKTRWMPIMIVIVIGIVLGVLILTWGNNSVGLRDEISGEENEKKVVIDSGAGEKERGDQIEPAKGPRGGKLFTTDDFSVEVTIFEKGVPPQFRLYLYNKGRLIPPTEAKISITLTRLGASAQLFRFTPEGDYLIGDQEVEEPHSFDVAIVADWKGRAYHWGYSQVEARVEMSDETLKSSGIQIATAIPAIIKPTLNLPGEIIFNEHTILKVVPRIPGMVTAVMGHHGQHVQKGDVLAVIESPMLADLRSQYLVARRRLVLAQTTYEREKQLWEEKITAKQEYLTAQQQWDEAKIALQLASERLHALGVSPESSLSEKNLSRYEIRTPIPGIITAKAIVLGESVKEDTAVYTVADVSTVWAAITVYPKDLNVVKVGQEARIKATAFDLEGEGTVTYITTLIGGPTRAATARVELDNLAERWRPGMFVTAELVAEEIQVPVAVLVEAIQTWRDWSVVFGRYGNYFEARPLELGRSDGTMVEVLKGLSAGDQYAAGNSFAIKAELGKAGATHDH
ncbi:MULTISPECIES: efflux RND transporter periplasmic adaptor subunit [Nitrosomonas]|uniref:Cobalt-zinc-cadmium efflux system membrane fusion protein n=1 Tax=Nitrosomonas communis TaxID=44574 RepID=A0A0F7KAV5_9PROT|nr:MULTISPECIES: efflux RND transporter periplasmic adaptor subunit [Nitrosomonas]AKH37490.1 hemolysin D [Nitrosomonas communis]TYP92323.1 cobalt-zinc-cadmium efflux system membrane fusion protein [Nitrosomonas communis]UVS62738.1 efflux RND transporter periplasmic adaptor subunit [Nitrosomonas sp. PLL12]